MNVDVGDRPEPFGYRLRRWLVKRATKFTRNPTQLEYLREHDYDILLVLDACRADVLEKVARIPVETCRSPGTATRQWLRAVEADGVFEGHHIVAANPQYGDFEFGEAELYPVWETGWVDRLGNVPPEPVLERTDELIEAGDRPIVAHLLPPHAPYITRIDDEWVPALPNVNAWNASSDLEESLPPQVAMARGFVDLERAAVAYEGSLQSTWSVVAEFLGRWLRDGHDVILTADHGETFGRWREIGLVAHPRECHIRPLAEVPFVRFDHGCRPAEPAETAERQLRVLGYR